MSTEARAGLRAARALLSLLEENSAEDFRAAEDILGSSKELMDALRSLRKFKEYHEEPLSIERLRDIVRRELVELRLPVRDMVEVVHSAFEGIVLRTPPGTTIEDVTDRTLQQIETAVDSPGERMDAFVHLLIESAIKAGTGHVSRIASLLRELAIQALVENTTLFPTLHALAQLRTRWTEKPLPYQHQESRRRLAERLVTDAERLQPANSLTNISNLLREGLRGPADGAIAAVRGMKPRKAHGE